MKKVFNNRIKRLIDRYNVISFDIFDTLIKRNCIKPIDIFSVVEKKYNNRNSKKIIDFQEKRIKAENDARGKSKFEDVNIDEIYNELEYDSVISEELKNIEKKTELEFCKRNNRIYQIYKYCKENNKIIICTSDMYLDKDTIINILKNNGYEMDRIYVSSDLRATKISGKMFDLILQDLKISRKEIMHVGDSIKADYLGPLKKGIKAIHINKNMNNVKFLKISKNNNLSLSSNIMISHINNNTLQIDDYYEKFGYEILGPLCCSMSYWIKKIAKSNGIDNLLFCARDMKLLQEIYNIFFYDENIKNSYLYISRKSTYLPYLYVKKDYKYFCKLIPEGKRKIDIDELLGLYNIVISNNKKILKKYNLDGDIKYDLKELKEKNDFKKYYNEIILKEINDLGKKQYECFCKYLKQLEVSKSSAIIDLGWRGTTQKIMIDILKHNINGMYFGLHTKDKEYLSNNYWTFLFDEGSNEYSNKIYSFMTIVEILFSALHGTTIGYSENEKNPYILENVIHNNNEAYITKIQKGALTFCKEISNYKDYLSDETDKIFVDGLIKIGISPTCNEAEVLGSLFTENIKTRKIADSKPLIYYCFHIKEFKRDIMDSEWKIGFMKKVLRLKLPYFRIYERIKSCKKGGHRM